LALTNFSFVWLIITFGLFSVAQAKLPTYILPAIPACAVLVGVFFDELLRLTKYKPALTAFLIVSVLVTVIGVPVGLCAFDKKFDLPFREVLSKVEKNQGSVALFMRESPAGNFYLHKHIWVLTFNADLAKFVSSTPSPHYLLVSKDLVSQVALRFGALKQVAERGKWSVFFVPSAGSETTPSDAI
jgi:4-amino-4-deoxy-L-arabinose transferase-like glycosyltransferase